MSLLVSKVIAGLQTGGDQGGLYGARDAGVETGGWAPKGWMTETGPNPYLGAVLGLSECPQEGYPARTAMNVRDSDGTLIFGNHFSKGCSLTKHYCMTIYKRPLILVAWPSKWTPGGPAWVDRDREVSVEGTRKWIERHAVRVLNVAGNRESTNPGIQEACRAFVREVLRGYHAR